MIINYLFWKENDLFCVLFRVIAKSFWIKRLLYFYSKLKHSHKILKCCLIGLDDTHCPGGKCPELMSARCQTQAPGRNSYSRCSSTWLNRCSARRWHTLECNELPPQSAVGTHPSCTLKHCVHYFKRYVLIKSTFY